MLRRALLSRLALWTSLVGSYGTALGFVVRFLTPRRPEVRRRSIYVAQLGDLPDGAARVVSDLRGVPVQLVREGDRIHALSTVCTHLGCRVHWEADRQRFFCPCHNGIFDRQGRVVSGPPPRPLDRYEVEVLAGAVYLVVPEPAGT